MLDGFDAFAVDCAGDIRLGGRAGVARPINVTSPFDGRQLHTFALRDGAIATSGIGKRSWLVVYDDGRYELLEPAAAAASPRPGSSPFANRSASQPRISVSTSSRSGSFKISWNRPG